MKKLILVIVIIISTILLTGCSFSLFPSGSKGEAGGNGGGIHRSFDKGKTWEEKNYLENSEGSLSPLNVLRLEFDIFEKNILYAATNNGLYTTENMGDSWRPLMQNRSVVDFSLNPKTRGIIYIASGPSVYKTTDNGGNWQEIYTEVRQGVTIKSIAISYRDTSNVYLLTSDGTLILSADWGDSWQAVNSFGINAKKLLIDPHNSDHIYVALDNGLYKSEDAGVSWSEILSNNENKFPGLKQFKKMYFTDVPGELIYLSRYGILRSIDSGNTWKSYTLVTPTGSVDISTMAYNTENKNELYYIVGDVLYHTLDNGANWITTTVPIGGLRAGHLLVDDSTLYLGLN